MTKHFSDEYDYIGNEDFEDEDFEDEDFEDEDSEDYEIFVDLEETLQ